MKPESMDLYMFKCERVCLLSGNNAYGGCYLRICITITIAPVKLYNEDFCAVNPAGKNCSIFISHVPQ